LPLSELLQLIQFLIDRVSTGKSGHPARRETQWLMSTIVHLIAETLRVGRRDSPLHAVIEGGIEFLVACEHRQDHGLYTIWPLRDEFEMRPDLRQRWFWSCVDRARRESSKRRIRALEFEHLLVLFALGGSDITWLTEDAL